MTEEYTPLSEDEAFELMLAGLPSEIRYPSEVAELITKHRVDSLYLGGSRRMAQKYPSKTAHAITVTEATDWDFYATYTNDLEQLLLSLGWRPTGHAVKVISAKEQVAIATMATPAALFALDAINTKAVTNAKAQEADDGYTFDSEVVTIYCTGKCQIVLRKDAKFYHRVFESISQQFFYTYLWKSSPDSSYVKSLLIREYLEQLFATAHAMEDTE